MIQVFHVLTKQKDQVGILSHRLTGDFEVILRYIERVYTVMTTSGVHIFYFVLRSKQHIVQYQYILLFDIKLGRIQDEIYIVYKLRLYSPIAFQIVDRTGF